MQRLPIGRSSRRDTRTAQDHSPRLRPKRRKRTPRRALFPPERRRQLPIEFPRRLVKLLLFLNINLIRQGPWPIGQRRSKRSSTTSPAAATDAPQQRFSDRLLPVAYGQPLVLTGGSNLLCAERGLPPTIEAADTRAAAPNSPVRVPHIAPAPAPPELHRTATHT